MVPVPRVRLLFPADAVMFPALRVNPLATVRDPVKFALELIVWPLIAPEVMVPVPKVRLLFPAEAVMFPDVTVIPPEATVSPVRPDSAPPLDSTAVGVLM